MSDYIGFSYGTKADGTPMHSSDLGIVRVSDGSRFNENLLPTMQDKTVQVPGGDGTYYFGSYFTQRQFTVNFAFDNLTEKQVATLKMHFGDKGIHDLIFDEAPYKVYSAKVTGTATIKYIPFDEGEGRKRIYKGEGSIQFTCYNPFARTENKFLTNYRAYEEINLTSQTYEANKYYILDEKGIYKLSEADEFDSSENYYKDISNTDEWAVASGMRESDDKPSAYLNNYDVYGESSTSDDYGFVLWNPGDKPADFILFLPFNNQGKIPGGKIGLWQGDKDLNKTLSWNEISQNTITQDTWIGLNSKTNLFEGYVEQGDTKKKTGSIYNQYLKDGEFFKIPNGDVDFGIWTYDDSKPSKAFNFTVQDAQSKDIIPCIEYNYYYF